MAGVEVIDNMFLGAESFNQDLSNWNTGNMTSMRQTFRDALAFNQNLGNWNIMNITDMTSMLNNTNISTENYDQILLNWSMQNVQSSVVLGAQGLNFCDGESARAQLVSSNGWSITDGGQQTATNTWIGAASLFWYSDRANWNLEEFPTTCSPVILPHLAKVTISDDRKAVAQELTIETGGLLEVENGAELEVRL